MVFIGQPKVLTRETILPDRNTEVNFLDGILKEATLQKTPTFQGLSQTALSWGFEGSVQAQLGVLSGQLMEERQKTAILNEQTKRDKMKTSGDPLDESVSTGEESATTETVTYPKTDAKDLLVKRAAETTATLTRTELFEDTMAYRAAIRAKKRDFILDERADREGMTIYELKTAATFVPPECADKFAVIEAWISKSDTTPNPEVGLDYYVSDIYARKIAYGLVSAIYNEYYALLSEADKCQFKHNELYGYFSLLALKDDDTPFGAKREEANPHVPEYVKLTCRKMTNWQKSALAAKYIETRYKAKFSHIVDIKALGYNQSDENDPDRIIYLQVTAPQAHANILSSTISKLYEIDKNQSEIHEMLIKLNSNTTSTITSKLNIGIQNKNSANITNSLREYERWLINAATKLSGKKPDEQNISTHSEAIDSIASTMALIASILNEEDTKKSALEILLKNAKNNIYVIDVEPREYSQNISVLASQQSAIQLALALRGLQAGSAQLGADSKYAREQIGLYETIRRQPLALGYNGYSYSTPQGEDDETSVEMLRNQCTFGWVLGPKFVIDGNDAEFYHTPVHHPLNLTIMVPAWIQDITLKYKIFWIDPKTGEKLDTKSRDRAGHGHIYGPDRVYSIPIHLPGDPVAVAYGLMEQETGDTPSPAVFTTAEDGVSLQISSKDQTMLVRGANLWNSPSVVVGGVKANNVEILPDMHNLLATFAGEFPDIGAGKADLAVITTRGSVFLDDAVTIRPAGNKPAIEPFLTLDEQAPIVWNFQGGTANKPENKLIKLKIDKKTVPPVVPELDAVVKSASEQVTVSVESVNIKGDSVFVDLKPQSLNPKLVAERFTLDVVARMSQDQKSIPVIKDGKASFVAFTVNSYAMLSVQVDLEAQPSAIITFSVPSYDGQVNFLELLREAYGIRWPGKDAFKVTFVSGGESHQIENGKIDSTSKITFSIPEDVVAALKSGTWTIKLEANGNAILTKQTTLSINNNTVTLK